MFICPYCQHEMRCLLRPPEIVYQCRCEHCHVNPYSKFMLVYNNFDLTEVSMILEHDKNLYHLSIRYDLNSSYLEKLRITECWVENKDETVDNLQYYLPVSMLHINSTIKIDPTQFVIESGQQVLKRLLNLKIFS